MKRFFEAVAVAVICVSSALAQDRVIESVEVRVANVDVVVTDRAGNPVTGLTKDDFELFENGKKQPLTNFFEASLQNTTPAPALATAGTAAPSTAVEAAPLRPRRILIFIDNYSLNNARRVDVLKAVQRFVDEKKRPEDQIALVVWNQTAKIVTPFTVSTDELRKGIDTLRKGTRSGLSFPEESDRVRNEVQRYYDQAEQGVSMTYPQAFQLSNGAVRAFVEHSSMANRLLLDGLRTTVAQFAGLDGKKVLVFAGSHLPQAPGHDLFFFVYRLFSRQMRNLSAAEVTETPKSSMLLAFDDLARQATMNDVALYFIDGGEVGDTSRSVEQAKDMETTAVEVSLAANNTLDAFKALADVTGGTVVGRTMDYNVAFNNVARDLSSYYSLGFRPEGDGGERRIRVTVKNPAYRVRARTSYTPRTLDAEVTEKVIANLVHGSVKGEWRVDVKTGPPQADGKYFRVPMEISMAPTLTLVPNGGQVEGGYMVYVVMGNAKGGMSKVMKTPHTIRIPAQAEADIRKEPLRFTGTLVMRPGENVLSVAVVDQTTNATGFATTRLIAQ